MNGDQIVLFPDGTKISKTIQVLPDLKFFNKRDKDGWTVIINNYLYEHPVYYPVECNNQSKTTLVDLKDGIKPELSRRNCSVIFPNNTNLCFDSHHIDFTKLCPTCKAKCTCSIKIHVENRYEHERFLACNDSYNKEFISDFKGRCKINTDYLQGELNRSNCNHFQRNDYQKSFLIHEDLSGDLLWNDKMVLREIENIQRHSEEHHNSAKLEEFTTSDGSMTEVKFFKNYYTNFDDKYLWSNYLHPFSPSESSSSSSEEVPVYQIGRSIFNILQEQETKHLSNIVKKFLNEENSTKLSL
ncbi:hypothetical protein HHI36_008207 [Cryptolaemus montrouzieri]|uniref:Uncharacterized protein n=1 Tax=Cryptolaemus montrouzieri TaxID=559131 RepID=A0ABD2MSQ4_9CUCU